MNKITSKLFENIPQEKIKTFTCDDGKEFSYHEELSETLSASFYFANPYHSWERAQMLNASSTLTKNRYNNPMGG